MRASISHIITFITIVLIVFLIFFLDLQFNIRNTILINDLERINYIDDAYNNILKKIDQNIVNDDIKEKYKNYITKDMINNDLSKIIISKDFNIGHLNEFYKIIREYTNDDIICSKYSSIINNVYVKNIFPINEYKLISIIYIKIDSLIIYSFIIINIIVILELFLYILNRNLYFNSITILSSGLIIILLKLFLSMTSLLKTFIYTNSYYTKFLLKVINDIANYSFILGIIIIVIYAFYSLIKFLKK